MRCQSQRVDGRSISDCDQLVGDLRWEDLPDATTGKKVNSRGIVEVENEKNLCTAMKNMGYEFATPQETFEFS